MKKLPFMLVILLVFPAVCAQDIITTHVGSDVQQVPVQQPQERPAGAITGAAASLQFLEYADAGITPDSPLWGVERAMEQLSLSLSLGRSSRAKKGISYGRERLMEVQAMVSSGNLRSAAIAQQAYNELMAGVEGDVSNIYSDDIGEEFGDEVEIEQEIAQQRVAVNNMQFQVQGLTLEQQSQLMAIVASMESSAIRAQTRAASKKEHTKAKIRAAGLTDDEINSLEQQLIVASSQGKNMKIRIKPKKAQSSMNAAATVQPQQQPVQPNRSDKNKGNSNGKDKENKGLSVSKSNGKKK